jgi:hypothetical protein
MRNKGRGERTADRAWAFDYDCDSTPNNRILVSMKTEEE